MADFFRFVRYISEIIYYLPLKREYVYRTNVYRETANVCHRICIFILAEYYIMSFASSFGSAIIPPVPVSPIAGSIGWFGISVIEAKEDFTSGSTQPIFSILPPAGVYSFSAFLKLGSQIGIYTVQVKRGAILYAESATNFLPVYIPSSSVPLSGVFKSDGITPIVLTCFALTQFDEDFSVNEGSQIIYTRIA
jgi:hypothetical protein